MVHKPSTWAAAVEWEAMLANQGEEAWARERTEALGLVLWVQALGLDWQVAVAALGHLPAQGARTEVGVEPGKEAVAAASAVLLRPEQPVAMEVSVAAAEQAATGHRAPPRAAPAWAAPSSSNKAAS